jgi:hypothetical protein
MPLGNDSLNEFDLAAEKSRPIEWYVQTRFPFDYAVGVS